MEKHRWDEPRPPAPWQRRLDSGQRWRRRRLQILETPAQGIKLGTNVGTDMPVHITPEDLFTHLQILAPTGTGKSFLMENIVKCLIELGHGVCVIDPHGDLYERLLDWLSWLHIQHPELHLERKVIPFDISDTSNILRFNPVARNARVMTYQVVALMEAIRKCWGQATFQETPRLARWLFNSGYATIESRVTLAQFDYLVDPKPNPYRRGILKRIQDEQIYAEWDYLERLKQERRDDYLESSFNRIRPFVRHEVLKRIVGQYEKTIDFPSILEEQKIFLANLHGPNTIAKEDRHLLGCLITNELLTAAFARPREKRKPFFLAIDEFAQFVTKDACQILDGGRKFGLHLILAHQFLRQLSEQDPEVYFSTLANARLKAVLGGLPEDDLDLIAREFYTGELDPDLRKDERWRTYFKPVESTRVIEATAWAETSGQVTHESLMAGSHRIPGSDFWSEDFYTYTDASSSGTGRHRGSVESGSRALVPFYEFHEERELASVTFRDLEEQLYIKKAQLKRQPRQHAAVLIPEKRVQLIKNSTMKDFSKLITDRQRKECEQQFREAAGCFESSYDQALRNIETMNAELLQAAREHIQVSTDEAKKRRGRPPKRDPVWDDVVGDHGP